MADEADYGGGQREHMFAVVSACAHSLALSVDDLFSPSLLPLPAPPAEAADGSAPVPLATQQWSVIESDIGNSTADPSGDVIKYFALVSYDSGKALALLQGQQGAEEQWQLAMSDFDSTSLACHWAALPVESATSSAAPEEQPQLLCLQAAANPELYLTAEEAAQGDAEDPKRKAGLSARPWAGGSAQSWTFMPVSSSLDDEGEDAADAAGPASVTAEGDLAPQTTGAGGQVMQYPAAEHSHEEVLADRTVFLDDLAKLHTDLGSTLRIPQMAGKELDLHLLYREVTSKGGLTQVTNDRKWREVTEPFNFPPTATSASFVLRKFYINLLHHFEQVYFLRNTGPLVPPPDVTIFPKRKQKKEDGDGGQGADATVDPLYQIGHTVVGTIHSKCEFGYFVSVPVGGVTLPGILYHPPRMSGIPPAYMLNAFGLDSGQLMHRRRKKKKRRRRMHGLLQFGVNAPVVPKQNRTAYNYFFGEWRMKLKAELPDVPDKDISKMIGQQWMALSPEQRLPYQALAEQDRLRYVSEMRDYHLQVERLKVAQEAAAAPILGQGNLSAGNLPPGATFKPGEGPGGLAGAAAVAAANQGVVPLGEEEEEEEEDGEGDEEDDEGEGGPGLYHAGQDVMGQQQGASQHPAMMGMGFGAQDFSMMDDTGSLVHASQYTLSEGLPPGLSMDESGQLHGLNNLGPPVLPQETRSPPPGAPGGEGAEGAPQGEAAVVGGQTGSNMERASEQGGVGLRVPSPVDATSTGEGAQPRGS